MGLYTHKEYMEESGVLSIKDMDKERFDLHRKYYSQYVALGGERYIRSVVFSVGQDKILASTDRRLNDIPLRVWDQIPLPIGTRLGIFVESRLYGSTIGQLLTSEGILYE